MAKFCCYVTCVLANWLCGAVSVEQRGRGSCVFGRSHPVCEPESSLKNSCQLPVVSCQTDGLGRCRWLCHLCISSEKDTIIVYKSFECNILHITPFDGIFCEGKFVLVLCFQYFARARGEGVPTKLQIAPPGSCAVPEGTRLVQSANPGLTPGVAIVTRCGLRVGAAIGWPTDLAR
jgi:hypothetical protein